MVLKKSFYYKDQYIHWKNNLNTLNKNLDYTNQSIIKQNTLLLTNLLNVPTCINGDNVGVPNRLRVKHRHLTNERYSAAVKVKSWREKEGLYRVGHRFERNVKIVIRNI